MTHNTELDAALKTSGISPFYRTVDEIQTMFGINVKQFPNLFIVNKNNLVARTKRHEEIFQLHIYNVKVLGNALGVIPASQVTKC